MGCGASSANEKPEARREQPAKTEQSKSEFDDFLKRVEEIRSSHPENRCVKHLTREVFNSFSVEDRRILHKCTKTGVENPDSSVGAYAMTPADYDKFAAFFDPLIRDYHQADASAVHTSDWDLSSVGANGVLDLAELGLEEGLSMRVRVGRNLSKFNLPGNMTKTERIEFEKTMLTAFAKLQENDAFGGSVYSLTPDFGQDANPNLISKEKYQELVDAHIMFKDMSADPYLMSAGIAADWPYGRGCYVADDKEFIIWFGEEDQLRIMCMKKGTKLNEVFDRLNTALKVVESIDGIQFASSEKYGNITSCPTNLGTGMRASVHLKLPNLTADGTDKKAKEIAKRLGLSVRGTGGEHTPIGKDGTVDISPSNRLFIRECDIVQKLYDGIKTLLEEEKKAAA